MTTAMAAMMETATVPCYVGGGSNVGGGSIRGSSCHGVGNFCDVWFFCQSQVLGHFGEMNQPPFL
jgi:hypothetical protein